MIFWRLLCNKKCKKWLPRSWERRLDLEKDNVNEMIIEFNLQNWRDLGKDFCDTIKRNLLVQLRGNGYVDSNASGG